MGLHVSCLQRMKHDEIPCVSRKQSRLEISVPPPPPRRIRSIPPPPPRMRTISNEAVAISKTTRDDDFYDIDDDKSEIHTNDMIINSILQHQSNINKIDSINIPPIPDTPKSITKSFNITSTNLNNNDSNNLININSNDVSNHHDNDEENDNDQGDITPIYSDTVKPELVMNISNTKQFTSNKLCVPIINKSNRGDNKNNKNNSNRTKSISATMSVTASNISALSSVASMISTLSPASLSAQSTSTSNSKSNRSYTSNSNSRSNVTCDSIGTDSSSSSCDSSTNTDRETNTNTNNDDDNTTTHSHTQSDCDCDDIGHEFTPISPEIDDNGFPDTDDRQYIHQKINVAQQHLSLQQSFAQSNTSQISQLSVAIPLPPPTQFGASFDSSMQQSPCTIIVTPASPANKTGRRTHSVPVSPIDKKCINREDSRSSIWEHPTDDELNELDSNKDDNDDEMEELKGDEDSYLTDEEDEVDDGRQKTVDNIIYKALSPKPTQICYYDGEEGNDEKTEDVEIEYSDTVINNDKKHRRSSILSTISALSRLTKSKCSKHENGIMHRLSLSNKLSATDRVTSSQEEQEQEEEHQIVRIICDDFDEMENENVNLNDNDKQMRNLIISPKGSANEEFDNLTAKSLSQCKSPYGGSFISRSMKSISSISPQPQEALSFAYSAQSIVGDDSPFYSGKLDIEDITKYLQEDEFFNHYWKNKNNNTQYVD